MIPDRDRQEFPNLVDDIGHDPARFLDWQLVGNVDDGRKMLLTARIRGIDRIEVIRAYRAVERALGRGSDGGPREGVMRLLDQREEHLEEIGERPDRIEYGPRRPPQMQNTRPEKQVEFVDGTQDSALAKLQGRRSVATDGGEPPSSEQSADAVR